MSTGAKVIFALGALTVWVLLTIFMAIMFIGERFDYDEDRYATMYICGFILEILQVGYFVNFLM